MELQYDQENNVVFDDQPVCTCERSWAMQYHTVYTGGKQGYKYGCVDMAICPCGHETVLVQRFYN